jgi:hypothetical protein
MLRRFTAPALLGIAALTTPASIHAQATCGATGAAPSCQLAGGVVTVSTTVQRIVRLSLTNPTATITAPTDADFISSGTVQIEDLGLQDATVRANANWNLTIQGAAWTAPYAKAVGDLEWTIDGGSNWTPMTTSAAALGSGTATAGDNLTLGYRTAWDLTADVEGSYSMDLALALSAP